MCEKQSMGDIRIVNKRATILTEWVLGVRVEAAEDVRLAVVAVLERFL